MAKETPVIVAGILCIIVLIMLLIKVVYLS